MTSSYSCKLLGSVLGLALATLGQQTDSFAKYFQDSLSFELDLQEHDNPDNNSNNLNLKRVFGYDLQTPSLTQVQESVCPGQNVPLDQCMWIDDKIRVFYTGDLSEGRFTGDVEIYIKNVDTGETWECHGGKYTNQADASQGTISYTDQAVPEGYYLYDFGYEWQQQSNEQVPDHTKPNYSVSSLSFKFRASDGLSGDIGYLYVPDYEQTIPRYSAQWTINPNLYDFNPAKRLLAAKLWQMQIPAGQTEETGTISSINQVGLPLTNLANPYYLKYIQTLVVFTDGGDTDLVKDFAWTPTQIQAGIENYIQTVEIFGTQDVADRSFVPQMPSPIKCGFRNIWQYATDIEVNLLDQSIVTSSASWNYRAPSMLYPDTFWPSSDFLQVQKQTNQYTFTVQNFGQIALQQVAWRHPLQVKISLGSFDPFYYILNLHVLGECSNLITAINTYAYQLSSVGQKPMHQFVLNRPGSERKIDLTPYFRDVKEDISLSETPSCGDLEYVVANSADYDFIEVVDNELWFYCDQYTEKTGTFDVNVSARLKWFVTETSIPVTFRIKLNENCNREVPNMKSTNQVVSSDDSDRIFTYGQIVLVIILFILSTLLGAVIAYLLVSPVRINGCSKVSSEQQIQQQQQRAQVSGQANVNHQRLETTDNVTVME